MNLCEHLLSDGHNILALGRDLTKAKKLRQMGAEFMQIDIRHPIGLPKDAYAGIIHCAALSSPWGRYDEFYQTNVVGTKNIIKLAEKSGCWLIHISTPSLYFNFKDEYDVTEDSQLPNKFSSIYSETKKMAEDHVIAANNQGLKTVILRPRGIFGPNDTGIVPRILKIAKSGYFPLINNGKALVDLTHVSNVSHAIKRCIDQIESVSGEIFNITNDSPKTVKTVLDLLFSALKIKVQLVNIPKPMLSACASITETLSKAVCYGFEPPITHYTLGLITYSQTLNINRAKRMLGYMPLISIDEGINHYCQALLGHEN